jgi:ATP-binding cassette subfamily B protein
MMVLTAPEKIFDLEILQPVLQLLSIHSNTELLIPIVIVFCVAILFSGAIRLLLAYKSTQISFGIGADLGAMVYQKSLYQPYSVHISRNSSEIISGISMKIDGVMAQILTPIITIITSSILLITIIIVVFLIQPNAAASTFLGLGMIYILVVYVTRERIKKNSINISRTSNEVITLLQESLGAIRDVIIDGNQENFCKEFKDVNAKLRSSQANNQFIGISPRYFIEAVSITIFAIVSAFYIIASNINAFALSTLAVIAFGMQRMLPIMQQIYNSWISLKGSSTIFLDVLFLLNQPMPEVYFLNDDPINFSKSIDFSEVFFRYENDTPWVLKNINLCIPKGSKIGIIGISGSGKSTFLDVLMGLLSISSGHIKIDGVIVTPKNIKSWQRRIAHVPQSIYLADKTIAENIAFGFPVDEIDYSRVRMVATQAKLDSLIASLEKGFDTRVGERGSLLSGGQRQRIGLARALYKRADLIILDEATSSLDDSTENAIMETINSLDKNITLLIVAHRTSTLTSCDIIYQIGDAEINRCVKI